MNRRKGLFILVLVLAVLALTMTTVAARATKTPFTEVTAHCLEDLESGREWFSDNIWHLRGRERVARAVPVPPYPLEDVEGSSYIVVNWNVNLKTGRGTVWGTFDRRYDHFPGSAYIGSWNGVVTNFLPEEIPAFAGKYVGHGIGMFAGLKVKGTLQSVGFDQVPDGICDPVGGFPFYTERNEGFILDPHGE